MNIVDLASQADTVVEQAVSLLVDNFNKPMGWPTRDLARKAVYDVLDNGFARGMLDGDALVGWVGGLPEYRGLVWELHPMVVRQGYRLRGIGRALSEAFEAEAAGRGALTVTLGTDDDSGMTTLSGVDLYPDLSRHIAELSDLGRKHPFLFYRKLGYVVTGLMPDANGTGCPDIFMSKRIAR